MNVTRTPKQKSRSDAGETLVEVLFTMLIIGGAISALIGGLATTVLASGQHRTAATANVLIRSYAEGVKQYTRAGYLNCGSQPLSYPVPATAYTLPSGWTAPTNRVDPCGSDVGTQQVHITLVTPNNKTITMDIWVRRV